MIYPHMSQMDADNKSANICLICGFTKGAILSSFSKGKFRGICGGAPSYQQTARNDNLSQLVTE